MGSHFTMYHFSMGTLVWKVSKILSMGKERADAQTCYKMAITICVLPFYRREPVLKAEVTQITVAQWLDLKNVGHFKLLEQYSEWDYVPENSEFLSSCSITQFKKSKKPSDEIPLTILLSGAQDFLKDDLFYKSDLAC